MLVAERLASLPDDVFRTNLQGIGFWLKGSGGILSGISRRSYLTLWGRVVETAIGKPDDARSSIVSDTRRDWLTASINSPLGRMAALLGEEFSWPGPDHEKMTEEWKTRAERLLSARGDLLCHVMAVFGTRLNWLYYVDRDWTDRRIIAPMERDPDEAASQAAIATLLRYGGQWSSALFVRLKRLMVELASREVDDEDDGVGLVLLRGWNSTDAEGGRLVTDEELREALIATGDRGRTTVLRHIGYWAKQDDDWTKVVEFIDRVWPRQLVTRTPAAAAALAGLAMSAGDQMPEVTRAVLPMLTVAGDGWADPIHLRRSDDGMVDRFPEEHVALLHAALGDDVRNWAYGIHELIERLGRVDRVRNDPRLLELRRRMGRR